jgi:F0F1-type ATP synthase membrane subunit b/b'
MKIDQQVEDAVSAARERHDEIGELREELRTILPKTRAQVDDMATILETYKAQAEKEKVAARQEITETLSRNIELERLLEISRAETAERDATIVELQVRKEGLGYICNQIPRPRF